MTDIEVRKLEKKEYNVWDQLVDQSPQGTIFHTSSWLVTCSRLLNLELKLYGLFKNDLLNGGCALFHHKLKGLLRYATSTCSMTPYGGIIMKQANKSKVREIEDTTRETIDKLSMHETLNNYDMISITNSPDLYDIRPFIWSGWDSHIKYTYYLDLNNINLSRDVSRNIKKAIKNNIIIEKSEDIHTYYRLLNDTFSRQNLKAPATERFISELFDILKQNKKCEMWFAKTQSDELAAAELYVYDTKRVYRWTAASDMNLRKSGAYSLLLFDVFQNFLKKGFQQMNLMAGNTPQLAEFITGFNPELIPYYSVEKQSLKAKYLADIYKCLRRRG